MNILRLKNNVLIIEKYQIDDIQRMVTVCHKNGYSLDPHSAHQIWKVRSNDDFRAAWLDMSGYTDEGLLNIILSYTYWVDIT